MLNSIRPLSLGTEGLAEALPVAAKTKERRRAGAGEGGAEQFGSASPGSQAHLLGEGRNGSLTVGRRRRERGFPAETRDAAELWTAPRERDSEPRAGQLPASRLLLGSPAT